MTFEFEAVYHCLNYRSTLFNQVIHSDWIIIKMEYIFIDRYINNYLLILNWREEFELLSCYDGHLQHYFGKASAVALL